MDLCKPYLFLFDLDGTLTEPRKKISDEMKKFILNLMQNRRIQIGIVTGSDLNKIREQLAYDDSFLKSIKFTFSENGLNVLRYGKPVYCKSIVQHIGDKTIRKLIDFCLFYIAHLDIPVKRGTFIEFRYSMINVSPIGRNCSQDERDEFYQLDQIQNIRLNFVNELIKNFGTDQLQFSIGGQISIDIFPHGWNKSYCLNHICPEDYSQIHFFGDKTSPGGNDYEIYIHPSVVPHSVTGPQDTINQIQDFLGQNKS